MTRLSRRAVVAAGALLLGCAATAWYAAAMPTSAVPLPALGDAARCAQYSGLPPQWRQVAHAGMAQVPAGRFTPGATDGYPDERPAGEVDIAGFWIDRTEVTNAQFAAFVQATGYVTEAERAGTSAVFQAPAAGATDSAHASWWHAVRGASWRHPEGPRSARPPVANEPVVQVTRADAEAYARWLGRALPTEAQWEYAARAQGRGERIERGPRDAHGRPDANVWQGQFPFLDVAEDGYAGPAPVGCFAANGLGLHDMIGNAWEWTRDPWRGARQTHGVAEPVAAAQPGARGLVKGGSFLCSPDFCARYRASARFPQDVTLGTSHVGFRTVSAD